MPRPKRVRETSNPFGLKLHAVMAEKNISGDYAAVASVFNVKSPSVYDWVDHARISKEHFAKLVEWSGRDLHWWFDIPLPLAKIIPANPPRQPSAAWPFSTPIDAVQTLDAADIARIDGYISAVVGLRNADAAGKPLASAVQGSGK